MCGIAGFSFSSECVSGDVSLFAGKGDAYTALLAARDAIAHRGPDDDGIFQDTVEGIGLVQTRLSILDLSLLGHQPMVSDNGKVVLVFNGEIYNFRELRAELVKNGIQFQGHSDTEVLLNLYLAKGEEMLSMLNGIFAFAIWDSRSKSLFLARDGVGVKPLYYSETSRGFAFSSEIKALLHLLPEKKELDAVALYRYMGFLWCPGSGTPLNNTKKLEPGEALLVRNGNIDKHWKWYQLPTRSRLLTRSIDEDWVRGTDDHLRQAVHRQMVSDVPVGAFLSGGLDSSAIVAMARHKNPDIRCFTIETLGGQEAGMTDDLPYARRVSKHLGVSLDVIQIDSHRMADDLQMMVAQLDEPLADPAPLNVLYISQLAKKHGIKVLLSGAGGDDLFTGYRRHYALQLEKWWSWLPTKVRSSINSITSDLDQHRAAFRRISKAFNGAALDADARLVNYFLWANQSELQSLFSKDLRPDILNVNIAQPLLDFLDPVPDYLTRLEKMLLLEQRFFLADHNLIYTDKMSMATGVEVRVPFLDLDLVDFSSRIPDRYKQRGSTSKWVLKKAMEPYLPHDVIYRPKTGFGAPLRRWMRFDLRELLGDMLSEDSINKRGIFDAPSVQRLIKENDTGVRDASYTLLSLLCIELWCRSYID